MFGIRYRIGRSLHRRYAHRYPSERSNRELKDELKNLLNNHKLALQMQDIDNNSDMENMCNIWESQIATKYQALAFRERLKNSVHISNTLFSIK